MHTAVFAVGGLTGAFLGAMLKLAWHSYPLDPVAWPDAPKPPKLRKAFASNELLENTQLLHQESVYGPEAFALHSNGTIYTGTAQCTSLILLHHEV